jgi:hypothetical protein
MVLINFCLSEKPLNTHCSVNALKDKLGIRRASYTPRKKEYIEGYPDIVIGIFRHLSENGGHSALEMRLEGKRGYV